MKSIKNIIKIIFDTIADCVIPSVPILNGVGMIKVVLIILGPSLLNIISETSPTYKTLNIVVDAGYYFLPVIVAFFSAKVFKTNKAVGAFMGLMLLAPGFVDAYNANETLQIFGLTIKPYDYSSQIFPAILAVFVMSYIYNFLDKHVVKEISSFFVPLVTILAMVPINYIVIGPIGAYLSDAFVELVNLFIKLGPIGAGLLCAIYPIVCGAGLGCIVLPALILFAGKGVDPIMYITSILYNTILGVVTFALYIKNKNPDTIGAAITASIGGTSEPAIIGFVIKDTKALISLMIADFVAATYASFMGVKTFALASFGLLGIFSTAGPGSSLIQGLIALIIGSVLGFTLCLVLHRKKNELL